MPTTACRLPTAACRLPTAGCKKTNDDAVRPMTNEPTRDDEPTRFTVPHEPGRTYSINATEFDSTLYFGGFEGATIEKTVDDGVAILELSGEFGTAIFTLDESDARDLDDAAYALWQAFQPGDPDIKRRQADE